MTGCRDRRHRHQGRRTYVAVLLLLLAGAAAVHAQDEPSQASTSTGPRGERVKAAAVFLAGGALALGMHEGGHLLFDGVFDARPGVKRVSFGPMPFFAITHRDVPPGREFTIASAGFWVQHATDEWLLTRRPGLRHESAPLAKGVLAFNVLASAAYSGAAMAHAGPAERDTRAMAATLGVDERWVGGMLLAPALLDSWRYLRPGSRWATWSSRMAKIAIVMLAIRAAR